MYDMLIKNATIIDLYTALSGKQELFPDKIHPNAAGAKLMAETIAKSVGQDILRS